MKFFKTVLTAVVLFHSTVLAADPDSAASASVVLVRNQYNVPAVPDQVTMVMKKRSTAVKRALVHTFLPLGAGIALMTAGDSNVEGLQLITSLTLITYGGLVGPSMGNFYAEDYVTGGVGIAMRIAGTLMVGSAIGQAMAFGNDDDAEGSTPGQTMGTVGVLMVLGSAAYNIFTSAASADAYNTKHGLTGFSAGYDPVSKTALVGVQLTF